MRDKCQCFNKKCKYEFFLDEGKDWESRGTFCPICNSYTTWQGTYDDQGNRVLTEGEIRGINRMAKINEQKLANQPKCPTCQSTNIHRIGGTERVVSVATLGLFSKKINKTFKCNSCGYTW